MTKKLKKVYWRMNNYLHNYFLKMFLRYRYGTNELTTYRYGIGILYMTGTVSTGSENSPPAAENIITGTGTVPVPVQVFLWFFKVKINTNSAQTRKNAD